MKQTEKLTIFHYLYIGSLFSLLLVNTLVRTQYKELFQYGEWSLYATYLLVFLLLLMSVFARIEHPISLLYVQLTLSLYFLVVLFSYFDSEYMDKGKFLLLFAHFVFILGAIRIKWKQQYIHIAGFIFGAMTILLFIHWMISGYDLQFFKSIYRNENYLGVLLFCLLFFHILSFRYSNRAWKPVFFIIAAINVFLVVASGARSVLIGILVMFLAVLISKFSQKLFEKLIYIVLAGNMFFVFLYVGLSHTAFGQKLNDMSYTIFEKNLFSGRHRIWEAVIRAFLEKPLFGHGVGVRASQVAETELTAHNMYLQVLLEFGLVGFVFFILLLITIWHVLMKQQQNDVVKFSAYFMLGILVYNSFELTLFQNNYSIAVFQWLIIGFGIGSDPFSAVKR